MESEESLQESKEQSNGPFTESDESSPLQNTLFTEPFKN
jgi:hypothetical protein